MAPLEFMQRLAALIPRPRFRFHGVLAPNARLHPEIIPTVPVNAHTPSADPAEAPPAAAPVPMSWARLLKRVFDIDLEHRRHRVMEDEQWQASKEGSPQGATVSPLLANLYLHYVFEVWVQKWRRRYARGNLIVARYADPRLSHFRSRRRTRRSAIRCSRDWVVLTLKTPYRDGTTHIVMAPLEFMQRLAALIPVRGCI